jgi:hypothetical protein
MKDKRWDEVLELAEGFNSRAFELDVDDNEDVEFDATNPRMVIPSSGMPLFIFFYSY